MKAKVEELTSRTKPSGKVAVIPQSILDYAKTMCICQQEPCRCPPHELYLVGSTVHDLLNNNITHVNQDYDFVMLTKATAWLEAGSFSTFIRHARIPNYYFRDTKKYGGISTDLKIESTSLEDTAGARDFHICAVFIRVNGSPDEIGLIYDPTGHGLDDLKYKRLNTIVNPALCFKQDPVRVLRAIKYLTRNYTSDPAVSDALRQWYDPSSYENDHFIYVLTQQLESPHYAKFIAVMTTYGLVSKMDWADTHDHEEHDVICKKLLCALYLRYYQRTIANYTYRPSSSPLAIAELRRFHAEKYNDQLQKKILETDVDSENKDKAMIACEATLAELAIQKDAREKSLALRVHAIQTLSTLSDASTTHQLKSNQLHTQLDAMHADIERQINAQLHVNAQTRHANLTKTQQLLQNEQQALREAQEKNRKQQLTLDQLRQDLDNAKKQTESLNDKFQELTDTVQGLTAKAEQLQRLRAEQAAQKTIKKAPTDALLTKKPANQTKARALDVTNVPSETTSSGKQVSPIAAIDNPFDYEYKKVLCKLDHDELASLFFKTLILECRAIIAYQLGLFAHANHDYFSALNYFHIALGILPGNQQTQNKIAEIKAQCPDINWAETDARYWCAKGALAKKENKDNEALLYYSLAIQCDAQHINAYIGHINIYYQQGHWIAFIDTYEKLSAISNEMLKIATKEMRANLEKIKTVILRKIKSAVDKQIAMQQDTESTMDYLNVAWDRSITTKLAGIFGKSTQTERIECYQIIIAVDPKKSIEYGFAHLELTRNYYQQQNMELAVMHYHETLHLLPCFKGSLPLDQPPPNHRINNGLLTVSNYYQDGVFYQEKHCYYLALEHFALAINQDPTDKRAYWASINCAFQMSRPDLIADTLVAGLIKIHRQERAQMRPFDYFKALIELHIYQANYKAAREALAAIAEYGSDDNALYCDNLRCTLSSNLIDLLREQSKQEYLLLSTNKTCMNNADDYVRVNRLLGKVAIDEGRETDAIHYYRKAKEMGGRYLITDSYKQLLHELLDIYLSAKQFDAANSHIDDIFIHITDPLDALYIYAKEIQTITKEQARLSNYSSNSMMTFFPIRQDLNKTITTAPITKEKQVIPVTDRLKAQFVKLTPG